MPYMQVRLHNTLKQRDLLVPQGVEITQNIVMLNE